ncbi:hypothetical protein [Isoptericola croceus]|uniref:hypothetical protein n=1 Tax=Isoptericola croceus TaxID=3031406 RepID=UPI0023F8BD48|nr:hypothetical protein [Isoptericola croceus]
MEQRVAIAPTAAPRTWWGWLLAVGLLATALVVAPVPASAHGGDVAAEIGTDGAGGVTVLLTWKNDGHPVEESAEVVVTGRSSEGDEVGPLTLVSASSGVGWYRSEPGELAPGHWNLEAEVTGPDEMSASASVDVLPPPSDEPVAGDPEPAGAGPAQADAAGAPVSPGEDSTSRGWLVAALMVGAAAATVLILRARRARN